jgi:hypothetical protein
MALLPAIALLLLIESMAAITLAAAGSRLRLVGARRLAIEATVAAETALAQARVVHDSALAALAPGSSRSLQPPSVPGWEVAASAAREQGSTLVRLEVVVRRRDAAARPLAARRATLLLVVAAADTAIVLGHRPRS